MQLLLSLVVLAALGGIAWALSDSAIVGTSFAIGLAGALVVLLVLAAITLRVVRFALNRVRLHLPSFLRQGLANLYRPGNQSAAVLAALGTGVMLILSVYLMQSSVLREIHETVSPKLPNLFTLDITTDEAAAFRQFFDKLPGVIEPLDLMPVVGGQFVSLNGKPIEQLKGQHFPLRMLENAELSWDDAPPPGDTITQGAWWTSAKAQEIAVVEGTAQRLHLGVGSTVELSTAVNGTHKLKVAVIYKADGQHLGARVPFVLPSALLKGESATWYGGAHVDPRRVADVERALFAAYPTVTTINLADVLDRIESVVDQITLVIRFPRGLLHLCRADDSCLVDCQHTFSADA